MKRRIIVISLVFSLIIIYIAVVIKINDKYEIPKDVYISIGDEFACNGMKYKVNSIKIYDFEEIIEHFGINTNTSLMSKPDDEMKYCVFEMDITRLEEEYECLIGSRCGYELIDGYSEAEFDINNNNFVESYPYEIGKTEHMYSIRGFLEESFTEKQWNELDNDCKNGELDIMVRFFDFDNQFAYYVKNE